MNSRKKEKKEKKKREREPKKSTGRDWGQTNGEQDKHLQREKKKIPGSGTIEFQS
jgi:hypothetical protein